MAIADIKTRELTFGEAVEIMMKSSGNRCAREGWNGKGMWIALSPGQETEASKLWSEAARKFAEDNGGSVEVCPAFLMKTADNKILPGWLASQSDMIATDWCFLHPSQV
jgi:hypothetical protein